MVQVSDNIRIGNYGVSLATFKLSKYCFVRQVTEGTDIGVDLYCESFQDSMPFLHFWVQVKAGRDKTIKISPDKSSGSYSFTSEHLRYWSRQPVPVFAFLISTEIDLGEDNYALYIIDITGEILKKGIPRTKTKTLKSSFLIKNDKDMEKFIFEYIPYVTANQKISDGIVAPIPTIDRQYEQNFPIGNYDITRYAQKISRSIRVTSAFSLPILIDNEDKMPRLKKIRISLTKVLSVFDKLMHWEVSLALGLSARKDQNYSKAISHFEDSISIIERDPNINQAEWGKKKSMLNELIKRSKAEMN